MKAELASLLDAGTTALLELQELHRKCPTPDHCPTATAIHKLQLAIALAIRALECDAKYSRN